MFDVAKKFYDVISDWKLFEAVEETPAYKEWADYHDVDGWRGIMAYINVFFDDDVNGFDRILADPFIHYHCFLRYGSPSRSCVEVISKETQNGFPAIYKCSLDGLSEGEKKEIEKIIGDYPDFDTQDFPDDVVDEEGELLPDLILRFWDMVDAVAYVNPDREIIPLEITAKNYKNYNISGDDLLEAVDWKVYSELDFLNPRNWF